MLKKVENYESMTYGDLIKLLGEKDKAALELLKLLWFNEETTCIIGFLAKTGIRGNNITHLFNNICQENSRNFYFTCAMLSLGTFSDQEVERNLASLTPIPFYNEDLESRETLSQLYTTSSEFDDTGIWQEFCDRQKRHYDSIKDVDSKEPQEIIPGKGKTTI